MSTKLTYNTLDVFTSTPFTGNQLGLVHVPASLRSALTQAQKQRITIEFNYSETVFLHEKTSSPSSSTSIPTYDAQIFTPVSELPFAGHPTIGTAVYIFTNLEPTSTEIILNLKAGPVRAKFDRSTGQATCEIPQEAHVHNATIPGSRVAEVNPGFNANTNTNTDTDTKWLNDVNVNINVGSIVRGMNFAFIDLSSHPETLSLPQITRDNIVRASDLDEGWPATLLADVFYAIKSDESDNDGPIKVQQRVIVIGLEDPATGAATGALTSYLALKRGGKGKTYRFELEQGVEMGRRSVIGAEVTLSGDGKEVRRVVLKGGAVEVLGGTMRF